jgi:hypothetical protein
MLAENSSRTFDQVGLIPAGPLHCVVARQDPHERNSWGQTYSLRTILQGKMRKE